MALAAFGPFPWLLLGQGIVLPSVVVVLITLGVLLITALIVAITRRRTRILLWLKRLVRLSFVLGLLQVGVVGAIVGSQSHPSTPAILGANGQPLSGSIAALEQVTLGGSQQWVTIRGKNIHNPVQLSLNAGPGAGNFPWTSLALGPLEDHFVVLNWDQPNTGKSYGDVPLAQLTPQHSVSDAYALTQMLHTRFHQEKIYVRGDSWGSIPGILTSFMPTSVVGRWSTPSRMTLWATSSRSAMLLSTATPPRWTRCDNFPDLSLQHLKYVTMDAAESVPVADDQASYPVLIFLEGLTGYRQMNTFQVDARGV